MHCQRGYTLWYGLDLFCTFLAIALILFGLYILPYLLGLHVYDVPEFVVHLSVYYEHHHGAQGLYMIAAMVCPLFIAGGLLLWIARNLAVYVETHGTDVQKALVDTESYEAMLVARKGFKKPADKSIFSLILLMIVVISLLVIAEYTLVISITR